MMLLDPAPLAEPVCDPFYEWSALGEAIDQHGRDIEAYQREHRVAWAERHQERLAIIARFGLPDSLFVRGPDYPSLTEER
jgi:hypothetical protein